MKTILSVVQQQFANDWYSTQKLRLVLMKRRVTIVPSPPPDSIGGAFQLLSRCNDQAEATEYGRSAHYKRQQELPDNFKNLRFSSSQDRGGNFGKRKCRILEPPFRARWRQGRAIWTSACPPLRGAHFLLWCHVRPEAQWLPPPSWGGPPLRAAT